MGVKQHTPAPGPRRDPGPAVFPPAPPPKLERARAEPPDEEVADFFEPVTFDWDEDVYIAREAARKFSEQIKKEF